MRETGIDDLLRREVPDPFQLPDLLDLIFPADENGVEIIRAEHPVADGGIVGSVDGVDVEAGIPGALPLVDVQARGTGKDDIRPDEVHAGIRLVPGAGKLGVDVLEGFLQHGIVRGGGEVENLLLPLFHLIAEGFEDGPVAAGVRKEDHFLPAFVSSFVFAAGEEELQLHPEAAEGIDGDAQDADEDRASRGCGRHRWRCPGRR